MMIRLLFLLFLPSIMLLSNSCFAKKKYADVEVIVVVSDSYHIYRSERVFGRYFSQVTGSGRVPAWNVRWAGAAREIVALAYYLVSGRL